VIILFNFTIVNQFSKDVFTYIKAAYEITIFILKSGLKITSSALQFMVCLI
jgi:hypothetical protein